MSLLTQLVNISWSLFATYTCPTAITINPFISYGPYFTFPDTVQPILLSFDFTNTHMFDRLLINGCSTLSNREAFMYIKNFRTSLFFFILIIAIAESGCASEWVEVAHRGDATVYVHTQSIVRTGSKVKVWEKWAFFKSRGIPNDPKRRFQSAVQLTVYSCDERKSYVTDVVTYAGWDTLSTIVTSVSRPDAPSEYGNIVPGSIDETIMEFVCKESAPKRR